MKNPLIDPQIGDIVGPGMAWQNEPAEVIGRDDNKVTFRSGSVEITCPLSFWREWMAGAKVIRHGA